MKAIWNDTVIAESDDTIVIEGNQYFPPDSLNRARLEETDHRTICPWKGVANYYTVEVGGKRNENAAWYYAEPKTEAAEIRDHVAFWKGVEVVED